MLYNALATMEAVCSARGCSVAVAVSVAAPWQRVAWRLAGFSAAVAVSAAGCLEAGCSAAGWSALAVCSGVSGVDDGSGLLDGWRASWWR